MRVGQVWSARAWVILVLEVGRAPKPHSFSLTGDRHVRVLVLADDEGMWPAGQVRWLEVRYVEQRAEAVS